MEVAKPTNWGRISRRAIAVVAVFWVVCWGYQIYEAGERENKAYAEIRTLFKPGTLELKPREEQDPLVRDTASGDLYDAQKRIEYAGKMLWGGLAGLVIGYFAIAWIARGR